MRTDGTIHAHCVLKSLSYRDVNEYLKRSGYHGIANRVMYGDNTPLFQVLVNVPTFDTLSLKKLVAHLPKFNKHLEIALQGKK